MMKYNQATRSLSIIEAAALLVVVSVVMVTRAGANEAVRAQAATGPAGVVDLQTAPERANPPHRTVNPDRTLHNNISMADHLVAKKRAASELSRSSALGHTTKSPKKPDHM
jgi:hypothetical protein